MNKRLLSILILMYSVNLYCQEYGNISGQIVSKKTDAPISYAKINLTDTTHISIANKNGNFNFEHLEYGVYNLNVSVLGYETKNQSIVLNSDSIFITISLKKSRNILNGVTVTKGENNYTIRKMRSIEGVLISQGKKTEVITVDKIISNKSSNIGRQLYSRIPGLNIWESDGAGLQLGIGGRGLSPTRTSNFNTRQNGYDISADALGYPESYYTPPSEAVKEIQLIRGAASLQFGTQFGGLLNFVMNKGNENKALELTARHTIGSFGLNSSFLSLGGTKKTWNYYGYYQYKFGNDWKPFSAFKVHNGGFNLEKYISEKLKLTFELSKMYYLAQQPGGLTDNQFEKDPTISNRERNWFEVNWNLGSFSIDYEFDTRTRLNSRFFGLLASRKATGFLGQINRIDPLEERDLISGTFKNFGNETRFLKIYDVKNMTWAFLTGFRYYQGYNQSQQGLTSAGDTPDFNYLNPEIFDGSLYEFPSKNIALFSEHIFNLTKKFSITPGLRFEYIQTNVSGKYRDKIEDLAGNIIFDSTYNISRSNTRSFVIAGIGLNYKKNDSLEFYSNFSQNYRSINFTDMQIVNPNFRIDPNLEDEKGFNFDIGLRGRIKNKLTYDVSAFALLYANRIGTTIQVDTLLFNTYQYRTNISKSITRGVEAIVEVELFDIFLNENTKKDLSLFVNASLVDARYIDSKEIAFENKKVELVPPFTFKTGLTYTNNKFSINYQFTYNHVHFSDATNSLNQANAVNGIIPSYSIMDLSLKYSFYKLQIESGINNLLDEKYFTRRATAYPGPGIIASPPRNLYFTLQLRL